ncbi:ATP-binding protein [Salinimonas lutimaris]|uniref:ATP-binding protein n=1 Tax=Salinimonas lutimaris TaxID=914153 RepID=UPI0010C0F331|nr:ATP-binding protein [Salinimonas lutimaris]
MLASLLRTDFMPHGHCYLWKPEILWLNVISDIFIALAYFSIPFALFYFVKRRTDLKFKGIFTLFSLFILLCGITHVISIFVIWHGAYGIHGLAKLFTAIVSCITAYVVYRTIPVALQLPSTESVRIALQKAADEKLKRLHLDSLRKQEAILRESTNSIHIGVLVLDKSACIELSNPAACRIFGYDADTLRQYPVHQLFADQDVALPDVASFLADSKPGASLGPLRLNSHSATGSSVPVEIVLRNQPDEAIPGAVMSVQDISARVAAEQQSARSEQITQNIIDAMPAGVHIFNLDNRQLCLTGTNPAADKLISHTDSDEPYQAFPFFPGGLAIPRCIDIAEQGGKPWQQIVKWHGDSQTTHWFDTTVFQSTVGQLIVMFNDVSEREQAKQALHKQQKLLERTINYSIAGVYVFNLKQQRALYINKRCTSISGYSPAYIHSLGFKGLLTLIHPEDRPRLVKHIRHLLRQEASQTGSFHVQYRIRHASHRWIWIMAQDAIFERDKDGRVTDYMGSFLDITPLRSMQENLMKTRDEAEQASRTKSEFLANMSHEIRTPMNAVLALTEMLLDMEMGKKQREYLSKVHASSRSLLQILNDVLDYSKLEAGKLTIAREPFDLFRVLSDILALFSATAEQKGMTLSCQVLHQVPRYVVGDSVRIRQILSNLLGNALKFTETGEITVTVSLSRQQDDSIALYEFAVSDTGIGIEEAQLNNLFSAFSQADSSISRRFGGTGLGLSICRKLAQLLEGALTATSEPGKGSCFTLSIPLDPDRHAKPDDSADGLTCLISSENSQNSFCLNEILTSSKARSVTTVSMDELMDARPPACDLLIIDITGLDNGQRSQLLRHLLATQHSEDIRVGVLFIGSRAGFDSSGSEVILNVPSLWVFAPFLPCDIETSIQELKARKAQTISSQSHQQTLYFPSCHALVVEDNKTNQYVASELLSKLGFIVHIAENGREAMDVFKAEVFDLVLMDLQMPVMDGYTASAAIRGLPGGDSVPIIAMSAAVTAQDKQRVMESGMDAHIPKPVDRAQLQQTLGKFLSSKALHDYSSSRPDPEYIEQQTEIKQKLAISLPGFETQPALARLGGSVSAYQQLLSNFSREYQDYARNQQTLGMADTERLRFVHTLKGLAKAIGATRLHILAAEAERSEQDGIIPSHSDLLSELTMVLKSVNQCLACLPAIYEQAGEHASDDLDMLRSRLIAHSYLRESDTEAWRDALTRQYGEQKTAQIVGLIGQLKYAEALTLMD